MEKRKIILASRSPRRKQLLEQLGLEFEIQESEYEEDMTIMEDPYELVKFLALKKTEAVAKDYEDAIIIGADTFIVFRNKFLGKPKDENEARSMLKSISGNKLSVVTGYAIIDTKSKKTVNDYDEAILEFRKIEEEEIDDYIKTGIPLDRAGAFGVQDKAAVFIKRIEGDYNSIVGLPIAKIYISLKELGMKML